MDHVALVGKGLVAGREVDAHGPPGRDHELVGGDDVLVGVLELPPPLLADRGHVDDVPGRLLAEIEDRDDRRDGDDREDQRGNDRPTDLQRGAAVDLLGVLVLAGAVPEAHGEHDDGSEDEHPYDDRNEEDRCEQVVDLVRLGALGLQRVLPVVLRGAGREQQARANDGGQTHPSLGTRCEAPHPPLPITCPVIARAPRARGPRGRGTSKSEPIPGLQRGSNSDWRRDQRFQ